MADQGAQQQQVNGTSARAAVPELLKGPSPVAQAQARIRAGRASTLAALESGKLEPEADAADETETETDVDQVAETGVELEAKADKPVAEPTLDAKKDTEVEKRLASVQAAEKRSRDKIAAERAELDKRTEDLKVRSESLDKFEALKKNIHRDPAAVVAELGITDDAGLEAVARKLFAMTEAGKKDPAAAKANAAVAEQTLRAREQESTLEKIQRELKETRELITKQSDAQARQAETARYVSSIETAAKDSAPLVAHLLATDPDDTHDGLVKVYSRLLAENGEAPDAADVVAVFDKAQRAKFTKLGVDPESLIKNDPKKNIQAADKKHPAKTLGNDLSTPRVPRPTKSDKEHRAETLQMLESGKLEP
jgi:hypothetical protein